MAYNTKLADRIRKYLARFPKLKIEEKKMFGGLSFLINPSCYLKKEHRIKNNFELPYLKSFYRCSVKIKLYQFIVL